MVDIWFFESVIVVAVIWLSLIIKAFAFVTAVLLPAEGYTAADRLTKTAWLAILGIGLGFQLLAFIAPYAISSYPISPIHLAASIAAIVFLVDVRPAVLSLTRR